MNKRFPHLGSSSPRSRYRGRIILASMTLSIAALYITSSLSLLPSAITPPPSTSFKPFHSASNLVQHIKRVVNHRDTLATTVIARKKQCDTEDVTQNYIVKKVLGKGKWAESKILMEKSTGHQFVARFLQPGAPDHQNIRSAVAGNLLRNVSHFMQLHELSCHQGELLPVWHICQGTLMHDILNDGTCHSLSARQVQDIFKQMHAAIYALITLGLRHRDLNENNVFYDKASGQVCIIDFGYVGDFSLPFTLGLANNSFIEETMMHDWVKSTLYYVWHDDLIAFASLFAHLLAIPDQWSTIHTLPVLTTLLGMDELYAYSTKYNVEIPIEVLEMSKDSPSKRVNWWEYKNECNKDVLTEEAVSMLDSLMQYAYADRVKAFMNIMKHPYYNAVL